MRPPARQHQDVSTITAAVLSILTALDGTSPGSPARTAYVIALRRRGEDLAALGGAEALREARAAAVAAATPDQAAARAALINSAWASVPGWTA